MTPKRLSIFVAKLAECGNVTASAQAIGISRQHAYRLRDQDPKFAKEWDDALETAMDALESEAYRRAFQGTDKPVFHKGEQCGTIREYSDTLTMFLLNGRRSSVFKHRHEVTGANGGPVTATVIVLPSKNG